MKPTNGSWIFISHSSADIDKVRLIRNEFEKYGQNPLAFHLKCLTTDTEEGRIELDNLIKREIQARDWFVYCESAAAAQSAYVAIEREYVKTCSKTKIWRVNMDDDVSVILNTVRRICCDMQVLLCYSDKDEYIAEALETELRKQDFGVWRNVNIEDLQMFGNSHNTATADVTVSDLPDVSDVQGMLEALKMQKIEYRRTNDGERGFVIWLLTENSCCDRKVISEVVSAVSHGASAIVFMFGNIVNAYELNKALNTYRIYSIPVVPKAEDTYLLTELLESAIHHRFSGIILHQEEIHDTMNKLQIKLNYDGMYHPQPPKCIGHTGPMDDYCDVYQFPCCGTCVVMGNGAPSQDRADGCCKKK